MIDRRFLGYVEVDSGTLLVGDPVYLLRGESDGRPGVAYEAVLAVSDTTQGPVARLAGQPVLLLQPKTTSARILHSSKSTALPTGSKSLGMRRRRGPWSSGGSLRQHRIS